VWSYEEVPFFSCQFYFPDNPVRSRHRRRNSIAEYRANRATDRAERSLNEKEGVFKVTVPRSDVPISVDGWRMPPFMGLTSWVDDAPSKPNVMKQAGEAAFPVCIKEDTNITDGFVEMKFKPAAGTEDQAGGVIWRCKDKDNYYIALANALEDNVASYHTIKSQRWLLRA
jgi:hypothetical protein